MQKLMLPVLALCVAPLVGCGHSAPPGGSLFLTPSAIKNCGANTPPTALSVRWNAGESLPPGGSVKLWINNSPADQGVFGSADNGTLWIQSGATGSATTGAWMRAGTRITMTDAATGKVITRLDVPSSPCQ